MMNKRQIALAIALTAALIVVATVFAQQPGLEIVQVGIDYM
jgi:hypothetical protein